MITGWIYKEWKQHKVFMILPFVCGIIPFICIFLFKNVWHVSIDVDLCRIIGVVLAICPTLAYGDYLMVSDDSKLWAYFVTTTSEGYRGFLRVKYEVLFAMIAVQTSSIGLFDELYINIAADRGMNDVTSISGLAVALAFLSLFFYAFGLPVIIRFGQKKGSLIFLIAYIIFIITIVVVLFINVDFIVNVLDDINILELIKKLFSNEVMAFITSVSNILVLFAYYVSYRISCRLYLKGAENYGQ
ncbi:MAG: hypothetical protein PUG10_00800 [Lachnospiraceae bacterium]|nr:hypothetical protein [Lachnospiraceae bacterium]